MVKLTTTEIKKYAFEVLCDLDKICRENNISYSLTGGTLIGAVRHEGFIPWDDDIDIMLVRSEYNRLIDILRKNENDKLCFTLLSKESSGSEYIYPFAKACHKKTELIEDGMENSIKLGVYVDIFPIDGAGKSEKSAKLHASLFQIVHGMMLMSGWKEFKKSKLRKLYYEPLRYICYIMSRLFGKRNIEKMLSLFINRYSYDEAVYAGRLVGDYGRKEVMTRKVFDEYTEVIFEEKPFMAIKAYDAFLTKLYGDYMSLPPVEKQVSHHQFSAYRNNSNERDICS